MRKLNSSIALAVLVGLTALAGCSVGYVPPESAAPAPEQADLRATSSPESSAPDPSPDVSPARETAASTGDLRDEYGAEAQQTTCGGGDVVVTQAGMVLEITDDCDRVRIEAGGTVVLGGRIGTLEIVGAANQVQATSIDELRLGGSGNDVRWETGTPETTDTGAANTARPATQG